MIFPIAPAMLANHPAITSIYLSSDPGMATTNRWTIEVLPSGRALLWRPLQRRMYVTDGLRQEYGRLSAMLTAIPVTKLHKFYGIAASDAPSKTLSFLVGGTRKTTVHYSHFPTPARPPANLVKFEAAIEGLVKTTYWTKSLNPTKEPEYHPMDDDGPYLSPTTKSKSRPSKG
jgi:hypothetical protein